MEVEAQYIQSSDMPDNPGCYIFKDNAGKIIYIGKAKSLKKRINNYFQKKQELRP